MTSNHEEYSNDITLDSGGSMVAATSKMERVVKPLTIIQKRSIFDPAAALDSFWKIEMFSTNLLRFYASLRKK